MTCFTEIRCCQCGEPFGMADATFQTLKRSSAQFHCPFGHKQHFTQGPSEADLLRQERDRLKQRIAHKDDQIIDALKQRDLAVRQARAFKGQVTKLKTRAAAGVCPCCNRTFQNLRRHMAGQHPGFAAEEVSAPEERALQ